MRHRTCEKRDKVKYVCDDRSDILLVIFRTNLGVYLRKLLLTVRTQYLLKNYPNCCKKLSFGKLCGKEDTPEISKSLLTFETFIWMILLIIFFLSHVSTSWPCFPIIPIYVLFRNLSNLENQSCHFSQLRKTICV